MPWWWTSTAGNTASPWTDTTTIEDTLLVRRSDRDQKVHQVQKILLVEKVRVASWSRRSFWSRSACCVPGEENSRVQAHIDENEFSAHILTESGEYNVEVSVGGGSCGSGVGSFH